MNWDEEQPLDDVKEMIICACDSIIDSGFEILSPDTGNVFNMKDVGKIWGWSEKYTLVKAEEKLEYEKLLGNRWRKVVVEVEPLRHIEA